MGLSFFNAERKRLEELEKVSTSPVFDGAEVEVKEEKEKKQPEVIKEEVAKPKKKKSVK